MLRHLTEGTTMDTARNSVAIAFVALLLVTSVAAADDNKDFTCGPIDCNTLKDHPDVRFAKMFAAGEDKRPPRLDDLPDLRRRFWEMYAFDPTSKDCDNAREDFAQALFVKDLLYLQVNVVARIWAPNPHRLTGEQEDLPSRLLAFATGHGDDGIPQLAQPEFYDWVNATRDRLQPSNKVDDKIVADWNAAFGILSPAFRKAANFSGKEYQAYVMERDWAEFAAKNKVPAGYDHAETYGIFVYYRSGNNSFSDANIIYSGMEKALGKAPVHAAAELVRVSPKTETGNLVRRPDLGQPEKLGPGGSAVPDYDAPVPKGVIGVYTNPALAMEILATQDDDRRYLLYLLKHQYWKNAASIKQATDEWTFAAALYQQLTSAFANEQEVLHAAGKVRTATKRWISGNVMDQRALGATRNVPLEAFEDVLAREDPRGYVRATLAFDQDLQTRAEVDAAYQKLVASGSEKAVLETAQRIVADKPMFGYRLELQDFLKTMNGPPPAPKPAEVLVDDPLYLGWKGFEAGAKASYATQIWVPDPHVTPDPNKLLPGHFTERHTFTLRSITPDQALFWLTEIAYDADGSSSRPHDSEFAYPAKLRRPDPSAAPASSDDAPGPSRAKRGMTRSPSARATPQDIPLLNAPAPDLIGYTNPSTAPNETGDEIVEIHGRRLATHWEAAHFTFKPNSPYKDNTLTVKVWTSDAVPSGLVRKTQDRICPPGRGGGIERYIKETWLESFEGTRAGVADPDPSAPATTGYVPPRVPAGSAASAGSGSAGPQTQPSRPTAQPPAPGRPPRDRSRPAPSPADAALSERFTTDMARFQKVRRALNVLLRLQAGQGTPPPADITDARDRLQKEATAALQARQTRNPEQEEKSLQELEDTAAVIEKYLNQ